MNETEKVKAKTERENWFIKWGVVFILGLLFALVLTGCNTVAGLGKDIHAAAVGIQDRMSEPDQPDTSATYTSVRR